MWNPLEEPWDILSWYRAEELVNIVYGEMERRLTKTSMLCSKWPNSDQERKIIISMCRAFGIQFGVMGIEDKIGITMRLYQFFLCEKLIDMCQTFRIQFGGMGTEDKIGITMSLFQCFLRAVASRGIRNRIYKTLAEAEEELKKYITTGEIEDGFSHLKNMLPEEEKKKITNVGRRCWMPINMKKRKTTTNGGRRSWITKKTGRPRKPKNEGVEVRKSNLLIGICGNLMDHHLVQRFDLLTCLNETLFWSPSLLIHTTPMISKLFRSNFLKKPVAFKRLLSTNLQDRRCSFLNEKAVLQGLVHDNILQMIGYCQEGDDLVIVFDYIEGSRTLDKLLRDTVLTFEERLHIATQVAQGLEFMHFQRITHSTINSKNILVGRGKNMAVKITSFEKAARIPQTEEAPSHQRPENDIYAFGIFLLELMTGEDVGIYSMSTIKIPLSLIDQRIRNSITQEAATNLINLAQDCTHSDIAKRPDAATVSRRLRS